MSIYCTPTLVFLYFYSPFTTFSLQQVPCFYTYCCSVCVGQDVTSCFVVASMIVKQLQILWIRDFQILEARFWTGTLERTERTIFFGLHLNTLLIYYLLYSIGLIYDALTSSREYECARNL